MTLHRALVLFSLVLFAACSKHTGTNTAQSGPGEAEKAADGCTTISGPNFSKFPVCYKNVRGKAIYQGDVVLGDVLKIKAAQNRPARGATSLSNAYRDYFWTGNSIPYLVDSTTNAVAVNHALADLTARSGLAFVARTNQEDYMVFTGTNDPNICGQSSLGRVGGRQLVEINNTYGPDCENDEVIQHETMHALGFWHEQARPDRDDFVRILFENIFPGYESQFDKLPVLADGMGAYDFSSVMHYHRRAFSYNGLDTIQADTEAHNAQIGLSLRASDGDVAGIRAIYGSQAKVVVAAAETSATVTFRSDAAIATKVKFGIVRETLNLTAEAADPVTAHEIVLANLTPKVRYFYSLFTGMNAANEEVWSITRSFISDAAKPVIIGPRFTANDSIVEFRLTTDEKTDSIIKVYTLADESDAGYASDWEFSKIHNHRFFIGQGNYKFVPIVTDEAGNETVGEIMTLNNDTVPPAISGVSVVNRTSSGATIQWTTDDPSSSFVDYGTSQLDLTRIIGSSGVTIHSVPLTGLASNTTYYFRVTSGDAAGNEGSSGFSSFSTDVTGPSISSIAASDITGNSAKIGWSTNEASDSKVLYGTSCGNLNLNASVAGNVSSHLVPLSGLTVSTAYCFKVVSKDAAGNETTSEASSFTTLNPVAPLLSNLSSVVGASSVAISWTSDIASNSEVMYGTSSGSYPYSASVATNVTSHSVTLTANLVEGQTYYYKVKSTTAQLGTATSGESSFRFKDTVGIQVINDSYYYQLARWVVGTTSKPVAGATTMTMQVLSRYTGAVLYSIGMTYDAPNNRYYAELPFYLSANDIYYGSAYVKVVSSLGGEKSWPY